MGEVVSLILAHGGFGIILLGEVDKTYWFYPNSPITALPQQLVAQGRDSPELKRKLLDTLASGQRDIVLDDLVFRTLLCGESNVLTAPPGKPMRLPEGASWDWNYDVLINPGHDTMGNWNKLKRRFEYWSNDNRTVMYTVNNIKNSWGTALRVYSNGKLLVDGNMDNESNIIKHISERWRVVTLEL